MRRFFLALNLIFALPVLSECYFNTADHIDDLNNPSLIKNIEIEILKSRKWSNNLFKIITDKSPNINPEFRDRFNASLSIEYIFGKCDYLAKVRVSGDWKDHLKLSNAGIISSIDIKLLDGNILNATRFKLLIPETRNSLNEILGALILRRLNFISPETFLVKAKVNNVSGTFIFQENAAKEMLERNLRREGAIFEGNESLLWSYKNYSLLELGDLSLSRLVNNSWASKGVTSTKISLNAFLELQKVYLKYANDMYEKNSIGSNDYLNARFDEYSVLLFAMNGSHALTPHNRKYYFNSLNDAFEPIYYDGDLQLFKVIDINKINKIFNIQSFFQRPNSENLNNYIHSIQELKNSKEFFNDFQKRAGKSNEKFFYNSLERVITNLELLVTNYVSNDYREINNAANLENLKEAFIINHAKKNFKNFFIIENIQPKNNNFFIEYKDDLGKLTALNINQQEAIQLMSKNIIRGSRFELLPSEDNIYVPNSKVINFLNGQIIHSDNISLDIDHGKKILSIKQEHPLSWVLIKNLTIQNWTVKMQGAEDDFFSENSQRFNLHGLTGCLSFYNVDFSGVNLYAKDGFCEDSLNIISSSGDINIVEIDKAYADAIDIDFSKIRINHLEVNSANNDCIDLSSGQYQIDFLKVANCRDKGLSIGEYSILNLDKSFVSGANIAIAAKDFSNVIINELQAANINFCLEVFNKKQEFGGAIASIGLLKCDGEIYQDGFSKVEILQRVR